MPSSVQPRLYRFGLYEADVRSGELRKNGTKLKIQGQPFEVLIALLERPNEVVTREELRQRLWPSDTFVDFDHSLNSAINKLRDLLGDTAANPRFIETLPKRGYRFLAPVQVQDTAEASETSNNRALDPPAMAAPVPGPRAQQNAVPPELPLVHRGVGRFLFALIQVMYLVFYIVALWKNYTLSGYWWYEGIPVIMSGVIVSAAVGIPMRLYLLTAAAFDYPRLGENFLKLWPAVFFLDLLWALSPFLLRHEIGFGLAFGACAALLYVPFSQRTLIRMTYPQAK